MRTASLLRLNRLSLWWMARSAYPRRGQKRNGRFPKPLRSMSRMEPCVSSTPFPAYLLVPQMLGWWMFPMTMQENPFQLVLRLLPLHRHQAGRRQHPPSLLHRLLPGCSPCARKWVNASPWDFSNAQRVSRMRETVTATPTMPGARFPSAQRALLTSPVPNPALTVTYESARSGS